MGGSKRMIGFDQHGSKKHKRFASCGLGRLFPVIFVGVLLVSSFITAVIMISPSATNQETPQKSRISYTIHAPISISGNSGFLGANASTGITKGSGTADDPYIIEGWSIDAAGGYFGIQIGNTDMDLIIRNCQIYGATTAGSGAAISLYDVSLCRVMGNTCYQSYEGICMTGCDHNYIGSNNCSMNSIGIEIIGDNTDALNNILWNNCTYNSACGIIIEWCNGNNLNNNNCSYNTGYYFYSDIRSQGIRIIGASNNFITGNNITGNSGFGICIEESLPAYTSIYNVIYSNQFWNNNGATDVYDSSHIQACDNSSSSGNSWNASGVLGNFWSDFHSPDNAAPWGIVDSGYYNIFGIAGTSDLFPLSVYPYSPFPPAIPEFSEIVIPIVGLTLIALAVGRMRKAD